MNKQPKAILESIKDLDVGATAELFHKLTHTYGYVEQDNLSEASMFIFPDGKIVGTEYVEVGAEVVKGKGQRRLSRKNHQILNFLVRPEYAGPDAKADYMHRMHPAFIDEINTYYNIIFVAVFHTSGALLIPAKTDPTLNQQERIQEARSLGWRIERG